MSDETRLASDAAPQSEGAAARPTPPPPFDLAAFARDTESRLRTVAETEGASTGPPPPFHPASVYPTSNAASSAERASAEWVPSSLAGDMLDCARRASLAGMQLKVGVISRDEAVRALRAELLALESAADGARNAALHAVTSALGRAMDEIGGLTDEGEPRRRRILVMAEDETVRDKVVLALEAHGHIARAAPSFVALAQLAEAEAPELVLVGVSANEAALPCAVVREMLKVDKAPVVLLAHAGGARLAEIARTANADAYASSDLPLDGLIAELGTILMALS